MRRVTGKTQTTPLAKSLLLSCASAAVIAASALNGPALANPQGGQVVAGSAAIAGEGTGQVTITQSSDRAVINWERFSIGAGERTEFRQPSSTSIAANRVIGLDPSEILGSLSANGQVVLINRNGVLFGKGATVDVAGLVATTHDIDDAAFMAGGNIRFEDGGAKSASVINEGTITIRDAGVAAFVAPHVKNAGIITAELGRVALGSGSGFTLDLYGDGLIKFAAGDEIAETLTDADGNPLNALVENSGEISAAGGRILLTAAAAREVVNQSVNISGVVRADSISNVNGVITLAASGSVKAETGAIISASGEAGGGRIEVDAGSLSSDALILADGTAVKGDGGVIDITADAASLGGVVSASGKFGGTIRIETDGRLALAESVRATGALGEGGNVSYKAGRIMESSTGVTDASGLTHGGTITATADSQIATSGSYFADGLYGRGGQIGMTADDVRLLSATLSARGRTQGGLIRVGGAFQGGKTPDPSQPYHESFVARWGDVDPLANAQATFINDATLIDVSAYDGRGGAAIIWSDLQTTFLGAIDARGATGGGAAEISSAEDLRRAELTNVTVGAGGHLLLDPKNIIIGTSTQISNWSYAGIIGAGYSSSDNTGVGSLEANDLFGISVSLNAAGERLAVGATGDDGATSAVGGAGAVYLFSFTDARFSGGALEAVIGADYSGGNNLDLTALGGGDAFGRSVSLNAAGDRLAVGAQFDDGAVGGAGNSGAVYLFSFTDASFSGAVHEATIGRGYSGGKNLDVTALGAGDEFGYSAALNAAGDRLAVGARLDDGGGFNVGAVYLFSFTDASFSGGVHEATIGAGYSGGKNVDVTALEAGDQFGASVSLNAAGDRLAVGAFLDDGTTGGANANFGGVYLFSFTDTSFTGGVQEATIGAGYSGGKNLDVTALGANDFFGISAALNAAGDRLAVGAFGDDGATNTVADAGAVYLFSFTDASFSGGALEATIGAGYSGGKNIDLTALEANDQFGFGVSLNAAGDRLAVGASFDDGAANTVADAGAVYLFSFTDASFSGGALESTIGAGYTDSVKNIDLTALGADDQFGAAVSLNAAGDRLAVGARNDDGPANGVANAGAVYLFSFTDASFSGGMLEATIGAGYSGGKNLDLTAVTAGDQFGTSVSLNAAGDRLAVGTPLDDGAITGAGNTGAVYLFSFTDTSFSGGVLEATIGRGYSGGKNLDVGPALEQNDQFGFSASLNAAGDRLAVGALFDSGATNGVNNAGAVYLFSFTDASFSGGVHEATIGADYSGAKDFDLTALTVNDQFGGSVSLNAAGDRLAVGALRDDGATNTATDAGAVYLFSFTDISFSGGALEGTIGRGYSGGKNVDLMTALNGFDLLGRSVSLNAAGDRLAVGAFNDDGAGNAVADAGAVHLFSFTDASFTGGALEATIGAGYSGSKNLGVTALAGDDRFGTSVSLNAAGDRLAVGAFFDAGSTNAVNDAGAVYLFSFTDTSFSGGVQESVIGAGYIGGDNLDVAALSGSDQFGFSVSLNAAGDRLVVGARLNDGAANTVTDAGAVYLFSFTDANFSGGALEATIGADYSGGKNVDLTALGGDDRFGASVSLNAAGDRLAVGAIRDDGATNTATDAGAVYLFSFTDASFSGGALEGTIGRGYSGGKDVDLMTALNGFDTFGRSVSLNAAGDRLAVGAFNDDGATNTATDAGAVYLFSFTDASFSGGALEATIGADYSGGKNLDLTALGGSDRFGSSVSLNAAGDRLAAGAREDDDFGNGTSNAGAVYLFSFTDTAFSGAVHEATVGKGYVGPKDIDVTALEASDNFGVGVSLNATGDRLAVGSPQDDGATNAVSNAGAVYLFSFADTNFSSGAPQAVIGAGYGGGGNVDLIALEEDDRFGVSVSLNGAGDRLAAGAFLDDGAGNALSSAGAVYLFASAPGLLTDADSYGERLADSVILGAADIVDILDDGTAVTLQASNDLTVAVPVTVTGTPGSIGALTLQAGRSILINADITTTAGGQSGAVSLFANDTLANGVVDAQRDAGAAAITMASGTHINAGAAAVTIELRDGAGKTNTASGDITLEDITAGTISAINTGPTAGSGIVLNTGAVLTASATGVTSIELAGDGFTNNAGAGALATTGTGRFLVWSSDPSADNRGGIVHDFKQYNATHGVTTVAGGAAEDGFLYTIAPTITPSLTGAVSKTYNANTTATLAAGNYSATGAIDGDTVTLTSTGATYDNKNVGTGKTVTATGISVASAANGAVDVFGYQMASTSANAAIGAITAASLTITGVTAADKIYDTNTTAALSGGALSGVLGGDTVALDAGSASGAFADKNVGTGKTVTASGYAISGADASNYTLTQPTGLTADITAASLTITGVTAADKVYDTNTTATVSGGALSGVLTGDTVTLNTGSAAGAFADKNVGTGKTVTATGYAIAGADASNYTLTQPTGLTADITAAALTITGVTAANKTYDANTTATVSGGALSGVLSGDTVTLDAGSASGAFADKNVGTGKTVTASGYALQGADASNYTLSQPTGLTADITAASLTITGVSAADKVYDTNTTATVSGGALSGVLTGDTVTLNSGSASGAFADKNVGTGKTVTASGYAISGADASNYTLTQPTGLTADITAASLTITGVTAADKVYDTNTTAALSGGALSGVLTGDTVTLNTGSASGAFADKNVGTGKTVTASGYAIAGADASNYTLSQPTGLTADISAASLTITGVTAADKVYDTNTTAALSGGALSGVLSGDTVTLNTGSAAGAFADKNVGTGKTVTASGYAISGTDAGNYTLTQPTGLTADISAATVTAGLTGSISKTYDTNTTATLASGNYTLTGVLGGDTVTLNNPTSGTYDNKNVGTGKTVTVTGLAISGADAGNYTLASTSANAAIGAITAASLTITGVTAADKVYDTNTNAALSGGALSGVLSGDTVTLNTGGAAGTFADKNVGTGKAVTASGYAIAGADAGNYTLTQPTGLTADITAATLTISGTFTASNKVYDATTTASINTGGLTLSGVLTGDTVSLNAGGATGAFADKNVGAGKTVTLSGGALTGADAGNYVIGGSAPTTTADITAASLTIAGVTAADKVYNANTTAALSGGALSGVLSGDTVTLNTGSASGAFADKNVGTGKTVTASGYALSGADAGNYTLTQPTGLTADITAASLTVTGLSAADKVYDTTTTANLNGGTLSGVLGGDAVTLDQSSATGAFADKNVGDGKTVAVNGFALSGADAGNYTLAQPSGLTADITAATLTVSGLSANNKVYDASTAATFSGGVLAGVLGSDAVMLDQSDAAASFDNKNVGTGKTVTASGFALSGADASNYVLAQPTGLSADITAATLTVSVNDAARGQNDPNPAFSFDIAGFAPGENESVVSGLTVATDATAGSPVGDYRIFASGGDAENYVFSYVDGVLTVTAGFTASSPENDGIVHTDPTGGDGDGGSGGGTGLGGIGGNDSGGGVGPLPETGIGDLQGGLGAAGSGSDGAAGSGADGAAGSGSGDGGFDGLTVADLLGTPGSSIAESNSGRGVVAVTPAAVSSASVLRNNADAGQGETNDFVYETASVDDAARSAREAAVSPQTGNSYWTAETGADEELEYARIKPKVKLNERQGVYYVGFAK